MQAGRQGQQASAVVANKSRNQTCGEWEEDTDYVRLAKAGGRKDLLYHVEFEGSSEEALPYPRVDWFAHPTSPELPPMEQPEWQSALEPSPLKWEEPQTTVRLPKLNKKSKTIKAHLPNRTKSKPNSQTIKLPAIAVEPVDLGRLLSMDYQREWLADRRQRDEEKRRRARAQRQAQRQKLLEHTMHAREVAGVGQPPQSKSRFIMKRFANVPSKLQLLPPPTQPCRDCN